MRSTYRLQITRDFDLFDATAVVPYLARLGVDCAYLSPLLRAEPGSTHGYDVVDPRVIDPERGGPDGLRSVAEAAHAAGLKVVVDIVPNHMGVATPAANPFWWDLLRNGPGSGADAVFDVDWDGGGGKVILPVLGSPDDLDALSIEDRDGEPVLAYHENVFPIAPGTLGSATEPTDARAVHEAQHYRLVDWHHEDWELNYRRFFSIKTLAGVRVEDPAVFDLVHVEVARWFDEGLVDGLRIDHIDGLADPGGYLDRLAALTGGAPVFVEKILEGHETLPAGWATRGTTGYEAIELIDHALTDPEGLRRFEDLRADSGGEHPFADMALAAKRDFTAGPLRAEMLRLARLWLRDYGPVLSCAEPPTAETIADAFGIVASHLDVYRTYLHEQPGPEEGPAAAEPAAALNEALESAAEQSRGGLTRAVELIGPALREAPDGVPAPVAARFQQTTGAVMAKGVEDTTFYRYATLTSLNEVGGSPDGPASSGAELVAALQEWDVLRPGAMNSLTTHDTKRSEDTRARIAALAEVPDEFASFLAVARATAPLPHRTPDASFDLLLWQAVLGAWPASEARLVDYALKAAREQALSTTWTGNDEEFEGALRAAVAAVLRPGPLREAADALDARIRSAGWSNGLAAKLLQLLAPGVPDVYQGTELWDRSLVDPDNRRPVDFAARLAGLDALDSGGLPEVDDTGAVKLLLTSRALRLRRAFELGATTALEVRGGAAAHAIALGRTLEGERTGAYSRAAPLGTAIAVATRLPLGLAARGGFGDTTVELPARYRDLLSGETFGGEGPSGAAVPLATVLGRYPVALLVPAELDALHQS